MDINSFESTVPSLTSKVAFVDVQPHYSYNEDLVCTYTLVDCTPQEHDRVAIYKIGWLYAKDFEIFEWAPTNAKEQLATVIFHRPTLPKNLDDIYQFCYITAENAVYGASSPFQFCSEVPTMFSMISDGRPQTTSAIEVVVVKPSDRDKEVVHLREENALLKETLKALLDSKNSSHLQKEVEELKCAVRMLKETMYVQQNEINCLKDKMNGNLHGASERKTLAVCPQRADDIGELETLPPFPFAK